MGNIMSKSRSERETKLLHALSAQKRITTQEAVQLLAVSPATARRLFTDLEQQGKVVRNYGGVQLTHDSAEYSYERMELAHLFEKQRIGRAAAALVQEGDVVYMDCGTTIYQMALALCERVKSGQLQAVRIVTNSLANMQLLAQQLPVILVGGEYHPSRRDFSGPLSEKMLLHFHFTKCFLGADGMSANGFTSMDIDTSRLNESVIARSDQVCVLLDSSKLNKHSFIAYAPLAAAHLVIVDTLPDAATCEYLRAANVSLLVAEQDA